MLTYFDYLLVIVFCDVRFNVSHADNAAVQFLLQKCLRKVCAQFERTTAAVQPERHWTVLFPA